MLSEKVVVLRPSQPFTWASGIRSPIYCDNRLLLSNPKGLEIVIEGFEKIIEEGKKSFDVLAGIATAGIPYASILADHLKKPLIYVRAKPKDHGKGNQIEGRLQKGQKVLVIEDLVSTGQSSLAAIQAVREAGGQVDHCLAIFTYGFPKAFADFQQAHCQLLPLTHLEVLIQEALSLGKISEEEVKLIQKFSQDPNGWHR